MVSVTNYIANEIKDKILEAAVLEEVIGDFVSLKKSGSNLVGDCPSCGEKKGLNVTPKAKKKQIFKCFHCEFKGNSSAKFLMESEGMEFVEALKHLAGKYNIEIETPKTVSKRRKTNRKKSFRKIQLKASGIAEKDQKYYLNEGEGKKVESNRYQAATIDKFWKVVPGDDMILHYVGLDGKPMTYRHHKGMRKPLIRVRWSNPALHLSKDGSEMKYQSPYKSGSHLWLPQWLIEAYSQHQIIETLHVCEGEKKADKMCISGLPAVGIMGIHNFANEGDMPHQFQQIIKRCAVKNVVFVLDSDWQEISVKNLQKNVENRPKTFFRAVVKFKRYFEAYQNEGINLNIFLAHGKNEAYKGIDDVLVRELKGKETDLVADFQKARKDRKGEGAYVNCYNITSSSDYNIKQFWHLHNHNAFFNHHKELLKKQTVFLFNGLRRRWNEEEEVFELIEKILPHEQFWTEEITTDRNGREKTNYRFSYRSIRNFLANRGFWLYKAVGDKKRFIHIKNRVVKEVDHNEIQQFVVAFSDELQEFGVTEMLLRGKKMYLGPDALTNMFLRQPEFLEPEKDCQYLFFKNGFWKITAEGIEQRPLAELPKHIWSNKIIDFEPNYIGKPMIAVKKKGNQWGVETTEEFKRCEMAQFYYRTSNFSWKKEQEKAVDDEGNFFFEPREKALIDDEDIKMNTANFLSKVFAAGYALHDYRNYSEMKAIICMDGEESEVGKSNGGTGKSIWMTQFENLVPMEVIDGKKRNLTDDEFIYSNVDERTAIIGFDDCRVNLDIEHFFSQMTRGIEVNAKREKRYKLEPPKFIFSTNHAFRGDGNSFYRRQYFLSFSDYYNGDRTVADDFGHQLFHEWDNNQWNLFYNWIATCIQNYLKYGLKFKIPQDALERRKLRQEIGEVFLDWATGYFHQQEDEDGNRGKMLNCRVEKDFVFSKYMEKNPNEKRWMNVKKFKEKIILYARYSGLDYNVTVDPNKKDRRIMSNGKEFFLLSDSEFDAANYQTIKNEEDLRYIKQKPF